MVRDDAMLAFERHATSKIKNAEDLLSVATLGFRGEALALDRLSVTLAAGDLRRGIGAAPSGTVIEINGGKMARVEEAGLPLGTSITVRDLFFNIPARKKFLKAESTELSHIASLVTHYALAHPEKHFELHSATNAMLVAPPVAGYSERVYQVFGKETLDQLIRGGGAAGARARWDCRSLRRGGGRRKAATMRRKMSKIRARCGFTDSFRSRRFRS